MTVEKETHSLFLLSLRSFREKEFKLYFFWFVLYFRSELISEGLESMFCMATWDIQDGLSQYGHRITAENQS